VDKTLQYVERFRKYKNLCANTPACALPARYPDLF
jgi:hypothetical protein